MIFYRNLYQIKLFFNLNFKNMEEKEFDLVRIQLGKYLEPVQLEEILTDVKKKADMTSAKVMGIAQECKDPSTLMII